MKKFIVYLFVGILFVLPIKVNGLEYKKNELISVDSLATVKTDKFDYNNFVFNSNVDEKGNSLITFESIRNNTMSKTFISIDILLFGSDQKNIGFLTYCTDRDLSSNYSGFKLSGGEASPFSINVVSKYFVEGKSSKDVKYIAVMDENKYCHVGGYDKYKDLTIDEIINGVINSDKDVNSIDRLIVYMQEHNLLPIIIVVAVSIIVLIIIIMIIKSLIRRSKEKVIPYEVSVNEPVEETLDLSYDDVDSGNGNFSDNVSMGEVSNNTLNDEEEKSEDKEDNDLTKFFN